MRNYTTNLRIWHWLFAFFILGITLTVLLRESYLNTYVIADYLQKSLLQLNVSINDDTAENLAEGITDGMWDWHIIFGYCFFIVLLLRLTHIFRQGFDYPKEVDAHKKAVYRSYKVLYVFFFIMAISGIILNFEDTIAISENLLEIIEEIHGLIGDLIIIFIPAHIIGVIVYDITKEKGLVSKMISGN